MGGQASAPAGSSISSICSNSAELEVAVSADMSGLTAGIPVWGHDIPNHGHQEAMEDSVGDSKYQPESEDSTPLSCQ